MAEVMNPVDLEQEILETANQIALSIKPKLKAYEGFKQTARAYRRKLDEEYLVASGAVKERETKARLMSEAEEIAAEVAELVWKGDDWEHEALREKLSALQSAQKSVVAMYSPVARSGR